MNPVLSKRAGVEIERKDEVKVTYNWLKDFVDIKISPEAIAEKLTMAGLEVTSSEERGKDVVFEIEVTANRPDCLSVVGIAREVAAITGKKLKLDTGKNKHPASRVQDLKLGIKIEDKQGCPLYTAKIIKDVKVGPSPAWLKERLELVGCRSTNNTVDITNYILLVWGEPLHAFDLDKLSDSQEIIVRRGKKDEKIITIDGKERLLNPDILVIADKERPIALAGVMGGRDTEVTEKTKNILLEAAVFNPVLVRRARQALGIQSESAYRFERGVDRDKVESVSWRAARLIQNVCAGKCVLAKSSGRAQVKKRAIDLDIARANKIIGINIPVPKIKKILNNLECKVKSKSKNRFQVEPPSHRQDLNLEIDLIEEIARIFGYGEIPKSLPRFSPQISLGEKRDLISLIKNILAGLGLNEVITYSLVAKDLSCPFSNLALGSKKKGRDLLKELAAEEGSITIANPLSKEQEVLRPNLTLSLAQCIAYNLNQKQDYVNIFEIAKAFTQELNNPKEEWMLGIALCGIKSWFIPGQGMIRDPVGPLHLKGILEVLFGRLGIRSYDFILQDNNQGIAIQVDREKIGLIACLPKSILDKLDIKKEAWVLEIALDKLLVSVDLRTKFAPLPSYPAVSRDISFIVKEEVLVANILKVIKEKAGSLLKDIRIIDYYKGKQVPHNCKGLTLSCLYRSEERTLTETEVEPTHSLVAAILREEFGATIR